MKKITTVILAAGKSTRFNHTKSKIFQDLGGISIIEHVFILAKKISNKNVIFVCNKDNINNLRMMFPGSKFLLQKKQSGTADAIFTAKNYLKNTNSLILFGDVPLISINSINKLFTEIIDINPNFDIIFSVIYKLKTICHIII